MTRGYVCMVSGKKILKVAYLPSDAYISYFGYIILSAICNVAPVLAYGDPKAVDLNTWMDLQIEENHRDYDDEPSPNFSLNWIRKSKESKELGYENYDYSEYGYLYDTNTGVLKIYNYGNLKYTVKPEDREKYLYIFKNYENIWIAIHYDHDTFKYLFNWPDKELLQNADMATLQEWNEDGQKPLLFLDDDHTIDVWHRDTKPSYTKRLSYRSNNINLSVNFIAHKFFDQTKSWQLSVQLPWCRVDVFNDWFTSERSVMKRFREFISANEEKIICFLQVCNEVSGIINDKNSEKAKEYLNTLDTEYEKAPWVTFNGNFKPDKIRSELREYIYKWESKDEENDS